MENVIVKRIPLITAVCSAAMFCMSSALHAALLEFAISGSAAPFDGSSFTGPAVALSGGFLLDTDSTAISNLQQVTVGGVEYLSGFDADGGVSGFNVQLDGVWSSSSGLFGMGASDIFAGGDGLWETFISLGGVDFIDSASSPSPVTLQDWQVSPDPLADFFLQSYQGSLYFPVVMTSNGYLGDATILVSSIPVPAAFWLFCSGLIGLGAVTTRNRS